MGSKLAKKLAACRCSDSQEKRQVEEAKREKAKASTPDFRKLYLTNETNLEKI